LTQSMLLLLFEACVSVVANVPSVSNISDGADDPFVSAVFAPAIILKNLAFWANKLYDYEF
jgi:hypothetical protein